MIISERVDIVVKRVHKNLKNILIEYINVL